MVIGRILSYGDIDTDPVIFIIEHPRIKVRHYLSVRRKLRDFPDIYEVLFCDRTEYLRHGKALPDQGVSKLKGVSVHYLPYRKGRKLFPALKNTFKSLYSLSGSFLLGGYIHAEAESLSEGLVLGLYLIHLVQTLKLDIRYLKAFLQISRCRPCFRV